MNNNRILELREELDNIDKKIIQNLKRRNDIVLELSKQKKEKQLSIIQQKRWTESCKYRSSLSELYNINPQYIFEVFETIHKHSIKLQKDI